MMLIFAGPARAAFLVGGDISMLPEIEKAGGIYRDNDKPADAITIFRDHGFNLFRVRIFVHPSTDYRKSMGATQDLNYVRALGRRIKASGALFLLDFHYSDSWADPGKQITPAEWKGLSFDALQAKVHDYTASVLRDLQAAGAAPDLVQVGNEITPGMLWPAGKVVDVPKDQQALQWKRFSLLFNAGARAVRECSTPQHPIRIVLHIDGGGREGLPMWFFGKFSQNPADYDIMGLSFYPGPRDSLDNLRQSLHDLAERYHKDVLIAEVAYPWKPDDEKKSANHRWPLTARGQAAFARDLLATVRGTPDRHGLGVVWWYPESIPIKGLTIWKDGAMALFDESGNPLPAMGVLGKAASGIATSAP